MLLWPFTKSRRLSYKAFLGTESLYFCSAYSMSFSCLTSGHQQFPPMQGYIAVLNILQPCSYPTTSWAQSHLQCGSQSPDGWPGLRAVPPKPSGHNAHPLTCSPRRDTEQPSASDLPLSVISTLNLDLNLGLTCCYICIQLILQSCGGGVTLLWQPNNSG